MCQAAHLLGKVLIHLNDRTSNPEFSFDEVMQLGRATKSFSSLLQDENIAGDMTNGGVLSALAMSYSASIALFDNYCASETVFSARTEGHAALADHAISTLKDVALEVMQYVVHLERVIETEGLLRISPFVADCIYQTAALSSL